MGRSRRRGGPDQASDGDADSEDLTEVEAPAPDPGHFLAQFNCAAAIGAVEEPRKGRNRLKRYEFAVEAGLGPSTFHRSKVGCSLCLPFVKFEGGWGCILVMASRGSIDAVLS